MAIQQKTSIQLIKKKKPVGTPGNIIQDGYYQDEYLGELRYSQDAYNEYDKMRRSDYQIKRALTAVQTPLISANYAYIPKEKTDKEQVKQAEFKNNVIKKWLNRPWTEVLKEIYSFLVFGFAVYEPSYKVIDDPDFGQIITLKDLGFRVQKTIEQWNLGKEGKLLSVRQFVPSGELETDVIIPANELMVFTLDREGSNYEGISMLRSSYGCWKRKYLYLKVDYIGIEKMSIGVPIAFATKAILDDPNEKAKLESILESYTSHEKQYLLLPDGMQDGGFVIEKGQYNSESVNESIKREDLGILDSVMASFLAIGTRQMGGNSQSESQKSMFLDTLQYLADYVMSMLDPWVHNCYVFNFGEPEVRLKPQVTNINPKNLETLSKILTSYSKEKWLTPTNNDEEQLREELGLSEIAPEDMEKIDRTNFNPTPNNPDSDSDKKDDDNKETDNIELLDKTIKRDLTEAEQAIDLTAIQNTFITSEKQYQDLIAGFLVKMRNKYLADLRTALKQTNQTKAIMNINIGFVGQLRNALREFMDDMVDTGAKEASKELNIQLKDLVTDDGKIKNVRAKISFNSKKISQDIESGFENNSTVFSVGQVDEGLSDDEIVKATERQIIRYEASRTPYNSKGVVINTNYNTGRNNFFFSNTQALQAFQYSAILDNNTTDLCRSLDTKVFIPTDTSSFWLRPPNHWNCRSILVPVTNAMTLPKVEGLKIRPFGNVTRADLLKQKQFDDIMKHTRAVTGLKQK